MEVSPFEPIGAEESLEKIREAKQDFGRTQTNCFFPRQALTAYAADKRLRFYHSRDALLFLGEEGDYAQVYYFLRQGSVFPTVLHEKPLVVTELDANGKQSAHIREAEAALLPAGFHLESRNLCLWIDLKSQEQRLRAELAEAEERLARRGYRYASGEEEAQREQILRLWREHLKPTDIPFSHYDYRRNGRLVCLVDEAGTVCSVIWWEGSKKASEWRHLVTNPAFLHQGLAYTLVNKWAVCALDEGYLSGFSWCEEHNRASYLLQEKLGSRYLGGQSLQYLLP